MKEEENIDEYTVRVYIDFDNKTIQPANPTPIGVLVELAEKNFGEDWVAVIIKNPSPVVNYTMSIAN